jgi:hypothetical protein
VMKEFGLAHVADNFVGNSQTSPTILSHKVSDATNESAQPTAAKCTGISGGQRRRLSIATELLSAPAVLFLDEPTSGLDATSTMHVVSLLRGIARGCSPIYRHHPSDVFSPGMARCGTTVVLSVHQPRQEAFAMFDSLILLGTGGYPVYSGPAGENRPIDHILSAPLKYAQRLADYDNPADFMMDILGEIQADYGASLHPEIGSHSSASDESEVLMECGGIEMRNLVEDTASAMGRKVNTTKALRDYFVSSKIYGDMKSSILQHLVQTPLYKKRQRMRAGTSNYGRGDEIIDGRSRHCLLDDFSVHGGNFTGTSEATGSDVCNGMDKEVYGSPNYSLRGQNTATSASIHQVPSIFGSAEEADEDDLLFTSLFSNNTTVSASHVVPTAKYSNNHYLTQLWIVCGRRASTYAATSNEMKWFFAQLFGMYYPTMNCVHDSRTCL